MFMILHIALSVNNTHKKVGNLIEIEMVQSLNAE